MDKMNKSLVALVVLILAISACNSLPGFTSSLDGSAWVLTHIGDTPVLLGSMPTLQFDSGQVSGFGSCNGFGGEYKQSGSRLTFTGIMSTLGACDPIEITQQETAYFSALASADNFKIESGDLILFDQSGSQILVFSPQDQTLEGKTWQMTSYFDGSSSLVPALQGGTVTASFEEGSVSGSAGCNHYGAPYEAKDGEIIIESAALTEMYCETPLGLMDQETQFLSALVQAKSYRVVGDRLTLYNGSGIILVEFILVP